MWFFCKIAVGELQLCSCTRSDLLLEKKKLQLAVFHSTLSSSFLGKSKTLRSLRSSWRQRQEHRASDVQTAWKHNVPSIRGDRRSVLKYRPSAHSKENKHQ
ncbi:hypothetical protein Q7C36_008427 [Tachysurus vachellii]|uniref:Uncharacterized protein n=1 Tax=Tachysurus vachellii TaxID=175792 RepID=A0AA88SSL6_TACVA|nr:hypothetical protein Q7C36_008427 [Tachysurus vachellii]